MNRQERRRQQRAEQSQKRAAPSFHKLTKEQRMEQLVKNGITLKDLEKSYTDGYNAGFSDACPATFKTIYAAVCLALNDKYGFGAKRCKDALKAIDNYVIYSLTSAEAIQAVYDRMKLELDFDDPLDRIADKEE